eukprot:15454986-Alexandrium_andersonii.AAC.1
MESEHAEHPIVGVLRVEGVGVDPLDGVDDPVALAGGVAQVKGDLEAELVSCEGAAYSLFKVGGG